VNKPDIIAAIVKDAYVKSYKMRMVGPGSIEVTLPSVLVKQEASKAGLTIAEFIKQYQIEYLFGSWGVFIRFIPWLDEIKRLEVVKHGE